MEAVSFGHPSWGQRLERARVSANLSQEELAAELGCSVRSVQDYEAGRTFPRPAMRRQILAFLSSNGEAAA